MSDCNGNCSSCSSSGNCSNEIVKATPTADSKIKNIIAVLSGKGGVGKSSVTSLLAVELARKGYKVGIMDGDITGPSIPKMFGLKEDLMGDEQGIFPAVSRLGIKIVSVNFMLEREDTPVLWRGPILGGVIKQFYSEVHWGELDYLLIDMPPGTGDVALSLFQFVPVDGIVMVTTPSKLVSMVVSKAINMAVQVEVPIVGIVDNMAYVKCDECGHDIQIYKNDDSKTIADQFGLDVLSKMPIDVKVANLCDEGNIEEYDGDYLKGIVEAL